MSAKADQQHAKTQQYLAALTIKIDQQADLTALGFETQQQIIELRKEIPQEV